MDFTAKIADRCGIELHPASSSVVDHVHFDMLRSDDSLRNEVVAVPLSEGTVRRWLFEGVPVPSAPILYSGIGLTVKRRAHLAESVLSGHAATYSMDSGGGPMEKAIVSSGPSLSMAAALQTRANGRVTVIGSVRALSDEFWTSAVQSAADGVEHGRSGNEQFVTALSRWAFGERALLRVSRSEHRLAEPEGERVSESGSESVTVNPNRYRIKDSVRFSATIEQFDADCDCWRPFAADDVQFELVRLDAFVRGKMQHDADGRYWIQFELPDTFGVYKLSIKYLRRGYGYLYTTDLVAVRPFRHDEYARFLPTACPYYLAAAAMVSAFSVFSAAFLFGQDSSGRLWP